MSKFAASLCEERPNSGHQWVFQVLDQAIAQSGPWKTPEHHQFPWQCLIFYVLPWLPCAYRSRCAFGKEGSALLKCRSKFQLNRHRALYDFWLYRILAHRSFLSLVDWMWWWSSWMSCPLRFLETSWTRKHCFCQWWTGKLSVKSYGWRRLEVYSCCSRFTPHRSELITSTVRSHSLQLDP